MTHIVTCAIISIIYSAILKASFYIIFFIVYNKLSYSAQLYKSVPPTFFLWNNLKLWISCRCCCKQRYKHWPRDNSWLYS